MRMRTCASFGSFPISRAPCSSLRWSQPLPSQGRSAGPGICSSLILTLICSDIQPRETSLARYHPYMALCSRGRRIWTREKVEYGLAKFVIRLHARTTTSRVFSRVASTDSTPDKSNDRRLDRLYPKMIVYRDLLSGDEMLSDAFKLLPVVDSEGAVVSVRFVLAAHLSRLAAMHMAIQWASYTAHTSP
jgi:Translationally controlled tumour protein